MSVAGILPGEGVELESGERIAARHVVSNADPRVTLRLLGSSADAAWRSAVESVPVEGVTVKVNMTLRELPNFRARPGINEPHHTGQVNTPLTVAEWDEGHRKANAGELPDRIWTELYMHTMYDHSVAPPDVHTLSVFAQYVPHRFARGDWSSRRKEVGERVVASIARFTSNFPDAIIDLEVLGPPGHRITRRSHGRPHFPGRHPPCAHVGEAAHGAHADGWRVALRRGDAPWRKRDGREWPQRGDGGVACYVLEGCEPRVLRVLPTNKCTRSFHWARSRTAS